jgi:hypothetical protein
MFPGVEPSGKGTKVQPLATLFIPFGDFGLEAWDAEGMEESMSARWASKSVW